MKSFVLLILSTLAVFGQVPSFKSFNPAQFNTNNFIVSIKDGATLTNITIRNSLTLPSLPDSTITLNGVTITNWTDIAGAGLWTNISNVLQPTVGNQVLVTNLSSQSVLSALGALTMPASYSTNLVAGTNCLNPYNLGSVWITGADATAAGSSISLVSGNGQGQLLILQNYSTNSGFTMYNGIPFCDGSGGFIRLNGDWATTNRGDTLFLYNTGQIWTEVGRSYSSTNIINGDNVWVNESGHIHPVNGNANNVLTFTSGLADNATNVAMRINTTNQWSGGVLAQLQTSNTNRVQISPNAGVWAGAQPESDWSNGAGFIGFMNTSLGDPPNPELVVGVTDGGSLYDYIDLVINGTNPEVGGLSIAIGGSEVTKFLPAVLSSGSAIAYKFDTSNTLTNGDSAALFQNNSTNLLRIGGRGISIYGYSTQTDDILHGYLDNVEAMELTKNVELDLYGQSAGRGQFGVSVPGLTTSISILSGFLGTTADQASIGTPIRYSPPLTLTGSAWDTDDAVPRAQTMIALVKPADGNDTSGSLSINMGISGSTAEVFTLSSNSGYTGAGTKFLSDDGTYKVAGGVGDTIWTVDAGHIYPVNGNTNNVLTFTSGLVDNATNVLFSVDSTNYLSANGTLLAKFANAGTNRTVMTSFGGLENGGNVASLWGAPDSRDVWVSFRDTSIGEPSRSYDVIENTDGSNIHVGMNFQYDSASKNIFGDWYADNGIDPRVQIGMVVDSDTQDIEFTMGKVGTAWLFLWPTTPSTGSATAYTFDTSNTLTNGDKLVSIKNSQVEQLSVSMNGGLTVFPNTESINGGIAEDGTALIGILDVSSGDPVQGGVFLGTSLDGTFNNAGTSYISTRTNSVSHLMDAKVGGNTSGYVSINAQTNNSFITIASSSEVDLQFGPTARIEFGPGATNALYRSGNDLIYTNGTTSALYFMVKSGAAATATGKFGVSSGGHATVTADTGRNVLLSPDGALYTASSSSFAPGANGSLDLGAQANQWQNLFLASKIVWNGTTNSVYDLAGNATPEGSITASPGSIYRNYSGGTGTAVYVKESGAGNTGWSALMTKNASIVGTGTSPYTVLATDYTILVDTSGGSVTVNLPACSGQTRILNIKKISSDANTMTIDGNASETIDGATTQSNTNQWFNFQIQSSGTNWFIL